MQATAPDSVGVKMPDRMPPRMIATVIMPQTASAAILSALRNGTISPLGNFSRRAMIKTRTISESPSSKAGTMPPMNRWATEIVPPAAIE